MMKKKSVSLSKIASALSLCYAATAGYAYADIVSATHNTQVNQHNGVEVVNIATPSSSGLSHNQYHQFDVNKAGAVLNNAQQSGLSQLAGQLAANPNVQKNAASVILNEVVSNQRSVLLGKQEIFGQRADYVLANPNGISCDGCGFINTPRASLVVGKPTVDGGALKGYQIDGNQSLTAKGEVSGANVLDLIAPTVETSGSLKAEDGVNVVLGHNQIDRASDGDLTVRVLPKQDTVLDGKLMGSIQSDRIRIHSTDEQATLKLTSAKLKGKDVAIHAGNAILDGTVNTRNGVSDTDIREKGGVKRHYHASSSQQTFDQTVLDADTLRLDVRHQLLTEGANIQAKDLSLVAGNAHLDTVQTTSTIENSSSYRKGIKEETDHRKDVIELSHQTSIQADKAKIIAHDGQLSGSGVQLGVKDLTIYGEKGIDLKGKANQVLKEVYTTTKNGGGIKLKSGKDQTVSQNYQYVASEIKADKLTIGGQGDAVLAGVKVNVSDDMVLQNQGKTHFKTEKIIDVLSVDNKEKYWGGLFGGKELEIRQQVEKPQQTDVNVSGHLLVDSANGVQVSGSRVVAKEGALVKATAGGLVIDDVKAENSYHESNRKGTIFNITKDKKRTDVQTITSHASELKSDTNLTLSSDEDIRVVGSQLAAKNHLTLDAKGNVAISGSENHQYVQHHDAGFSLSGKVEKPKVSFDHESAISGAVDTAIGVIEGTTKPEDAFKKVVETVKGNIHAEASASATLGIHSNHANTHDITHQAANVQAGTVAVNAKKDVTVAGSQLTANQGDLTVSAQNIHTLAQDNTKTEDKRETTVGLTNKVKVNENEISNTLSLGVKHDHYQNEKTQAQASQLNANNDVHLQANTIAHQGSQLNAGHNVVQKAEVLTQSAANNVDNQHHQNVDVGVTLTTGINKDKAINGSLKLTAAGGHDNTDTVTAQGTHIQAGNHVQIDAKQLTDVGTKYDAKQDVVLNSNQHDISSAQNSEHKDKLNAGVSIGVSANTKDLQTVNAKVNVGANFQKEQSDSTSAAKAEVNGNNVHITTTQLNSQADLTAKEDLVINSQNAHFTPSHHQTNSTGGGFTADVGVGALVIPAATAAIPSVSVNVSANGHNNHSDTAISHTLTGNNVTINAADQVNMQGTNIQAGQSANIHANTVNIGAAANTTHGVGAEVGAGVSVGANVSDLGVNAKVNVNKEDSTQHTAVAVNGQTVNITAQDGVTLSGVQSDSHHLNVDSGKGDLTVNGPSDTVKKTDVGVHIGLNGGLGNGAWNVAGGSAGVKVEVVDNHTHTASTLNTDQANVNTHHLNFTGSSLNANTVTGTVQGNVVNRPVTDKINETSVNLSASGSGKPTPYPDGKWLSSAKADWDNGTIAGVKGEATIAVDSVKKQETAPVGIQSLTNNMNVYGSSTTYTAPANKTQTAKVNVHATTDVAELSRQFWANRKKYK